MERTKIFGEGKYLVHGGEKNRLVKGGILWRRKIIGDADQLSEYRAICLFESKKIEKKANICNLDEFHFSKKEFYLQPSVDSTAVSKFVVIHIYLLRRQCCQNLAS